MKIRKFVALIAGMFVLAALALIVPVTNVVPKTTQPVAEAAPVGYVYNYRYSTSSLKVFSGKKGHGTNDRVKPGKTSRTWRVGFPDSFAVNPGCRVSLDTKFSFTHTWYVSTGKKATTMYYNFPASFRGQKVIAEVVCSYPPHRN